MFSTPTRAKVAVASTIGAGAFLFAGVGAAAAGVLPDAAQDTASTVLGQLGFEVPRADEAAGVHPAQRGPAEDAADAGTDTEVAETETDATESDAATEASEGKGAAVSGLATTTEAEGVDKGAEISTFASGGKSRAGADHPTPQGAEDDADADTTGDLAPDAHPDNGGAATADESSSGRSAAGSGHRP